MYCLESVKQKVQMKLGQLPTFQNNLAKSKTSKIIIDVILILNENVPGIFKRTNTQ